MPSAFCYANRKPADNIIGGAEIRYYDNLLNGVDFSTMIIIVYCNRF